MLPISRLVLCLGLLQVVLHAGELAYKPAPVNNPLKGLIGESYSRAEREFPHSLEYLGLPFARLMPEQDRFDWSSLEATLEKIANRGRQVVIRVYLDWPGREATIPKFLHTSTQVAGNVAWRKGERFPDYESPEIRSALTKFIAAFGQRYDGNPIIGFIEAGLLGAWGEWLPQGPTAPMASRAVQKEILDAYESAFRSTRILVRYPSELTVERSFGYHDDWFGHLSRELPSFLANVQITNSASWQKTPIGGRAHPQIRDCLWKPEPCRLTEEKYLERLRAGHFTYLRVGFGSMLYEPGPGRERALKFAQTLGYELHVSSAEILAENKSFTISAAITNTGIAPFYYKWPVEVALARGSKLWQIWPTDWDLRQVIPGNKALNFKFHELNFSPPPGKYIVLVRARNPAPNGPRFSFANVAENSSIDGWLTLGDIVLTP